MKNILFLVVIGLLSIANKGTQASNHLPDTVIIQNDKEMKIEWCAYFDHKTDYNQRINLVSELFFNQMELISIDDVSHYERIKAEVRIDKDSVVLVKITEWTEDNILYFYKENNIQVGVYYNVYYKIIDPVMGEINIYTSDTDAFDRLNSKTLTTIFKTVIDNDDVIETNWLKRNSCEKHVFDWSSDDSKIHKISSEFSGSQDQIELSAGLTAYYVHNTLVPGFSATMSFRFGQKELSSNAFSVFYNPEYIFTEDDQGSFNSQMNSWIGLGYMRMYTNSKNEKAGYGMNFSYLMKRNGNFYKENTMRLQVYTNGGKGLKLIPNIYIEEGFKKIYPGFGVQISF
ncbi:MAG: hypothetical protein JEZ03_08665 [Bacteroidales bacterium]|nr:hypothetical protein [Bacteroidales bacterium]